MSDIIYMYCTFSCRYVSREHLVYSEVCKLVLCVCAVGTIKTALRWSTVVWDGNYNGLRSMWLREEEEQRGLSPASSPCSGSAGQSSKGQKVKMGGGISFPEAGIHWSICQAVSAMVLSLLACHYGVEGRHCNTNPTWEIIQLLGRVWELGVDLRFASKNTFSSLTRFSHISFDTVLDFWLTGLVQRQPSSTSSIKCCRKHGRDASEKKTMYSASFALARMLVKRTNLLWFHTMFTSQETTMFAPELDHRQQLFSKSNGIWRFVLSCTF